MFYIFLFSVLAVLLVAVVLNRNARDKDSSVEPPARSSSPGASRTPSGSAERQERKRRRAQSKKGRRKRH